MEPSVKSGCKNVKFFGLCNGEIVGLAMDDNMKKDLCIHAFESACRMHGAYGMILHSDWDIQFTSSGFRNVLPQYGALQSMSGTGRCYDNARMESFFATLKKRNSIRSRPKAADSLGQEHCVPLYYDLLQPGANLFQRSGRPCSRHVSSGRQRPGCLNSTIMGVLVLYCS